MGFYGWWRPTVAVPVAGVMLALAGGAHAEADVLERPALTSVRAERSVMLGIGRAGERLVAVGERGIILLSDDAGRSWRQAASPVSVSLTAVSFAGQSKGWAVGHGGVVLHTVDGGESWAVQLDGRKAAAAILEDARANGSDERAVANAERVAADGADKPFLAVHFFDEQRGLVVGAYGLAFATEDGGKRWSPLGARLDNRDGMHLYAIQPIGYRVYLAGEQGTLFASNDDGRTFQRLASPYAGSFFGLADGGSGELVAFGMRGNVYWSADGGMTWQRSEVPGTASLTAGTTSGTRVVLTDDGGQLLESRDGGRSFAVVGARRLAPLTGVEVSGDEGFVVSGMRGVARVTMNDNGGEVR